MTGFFISLEGIEGSGKSLSVNYLAQKLSAYNLPTLITREPGGTKFGEQIREILLHKTEQINCNAELLLMFAARAQHLSQIIIPALNAGKIVICDRFIDSTYAYQGAGRNINLNIIGNLEQMFISNIPNLTLLFDVEVTEGLKRAKKRSKPDRFERENIDFFQHVRFAYLERAKLEPNRIKIIDSNKSLANVHTQLDALIIPIAKKLNS